MALKSINEHPKITDTILLEILTPDALGCFDDNPYRVDSVTIYHVERDFLGQNYGEYTKITVSDVLTAKLTAAQKALCDSPTADNIAKVQRILSEIESKSQSSMFYYKDRIVVKTIGTTATPAWLSVDTENALITLEDEDSNGDPQYGHFSYEWSPNGSIREGDYFVCWTWSPNISGEKLSAHVQFTIDGDPHSVMTIPTHVTQTDKYDILLERYLPEMYKLTLTDNDLTPETLDTLNVSVAQGFTFLEDMANQIIDLFDANALHESMLIYMSNLFNLKLKSDDPTLWRRQIKQAIPLFKKKGTLDGLKEAFAQAGMLLNSFTQYWQLVSPYTCTESFLVSDEITFKLSKMSLIEPIDTDNFGLWLKPAGEEDYTTLNEDYISFDVAEDGFITFTWIGDELPSNAIELAAGDRVKILYQYNEIPGPTEQQHEDYIQSLPLADQRDENDQLYPFKNWNVRIIDDQDPLFSVLVPVRHPFHDNLIFGHIRTEFAYSENIYNMDEFNGSTRPSTDPCHIDAKFVDPCGSCLSSTYSVDIGVQELSNDRMIEAQEILREFTPFHSQIHSINFTGEVNEFVLSPVETIETLITFDYAQFILSGDANPFFNRMMYHGLTDENYIIDRESLTDQVTILTGELGTAYNDEVTLISPDVSLQNAGISFDNHIVEVLSPSSNAGTYTIKNIKGHLAKVASNAIEPVDESAFTFNIDNILYSNNTSSIQRDNLCKFSDVNQDFSTLGVKSLWDVDFTPDYAGDTWKVSIPAYSATPYEIIKVVNGVLYLKDTNTLPTTTTSGITYTLLDDDDEEQADGATGVLNVTRRGYVSINDAELIDLSDVLRPGDQVHYSGTDYNVNEMDDRSFWIENYSGGNVAGASIYTKRTVVKEAIGYFGYRGLRLTTWSDHEAEFGIMNGSNPPHPTLQTDNSLFKENFMFLINGDYFKIVSIDGKEVVLSGREQSWMTLDAGGTAVAYSLVHLPLKEINIGLIPFDQLNRNGKDPVIQEIESSVDQSIVVAALSMPSGGRINENISQDEGISFIIETLDGQITEGTL